MFDTPTVDSGFAGFCLHLLLSFGSDPPPVEGIKTISPSYVVVFYYKNIYNFTTESSADWGGNVS